MSKIKIGITQGDINGVGYEVILKTFSEPHLMELCIPVLYGSQKLAQAHKQKLTDIQVNMQVIADANMAQERKLNIISCTDDKVTVNFGKGSEESAKAALDSLERACNDLREGQIDALVTLSTNPFKYLVAPRIIAGIIVLPLLVFIGDIIGIFGGYVICVYKLGFNPANYINSTLQNMEAIDIISGLVKASVFGFIITLMGCYNGYKSKGGAQGVGEATTNAVVSASILILVFNYILTELFFAK